MRTRRRLTDTKAIQTLKILELEERLKQLQEQEFIIKMVDHWTRKNFKLMEKVQKEMKEVRKALNK